MRIRVDHYVYRNKVGGNFIYVVLYANDIFLVENNMDLIRKVKLYLLSKFYMKDLEAKNFIIGMKIQRDCAGRRI